jgi:tetratricopeptide (TPR) repeat protein
MSTTLADAEQLLAQGEAAAAQHAVSAVLKADPSNPRAHYLAGRIERLAGHSKDAERLLRRAAELEPAHVDTHLELAALLRVQRDYDHCLDELGAALYYDPGCARAYFELGFVHRLQGDLAGAEEFFRKAAELDQTMARAHVELGWVHLMREEYAAAIAELEKAIELDPQSLVGNSNLGFAYVKTEQYQRALAVFSDLISRTPKRALWPRINLGNAYEHTGQFDEAERIWGEILQHEPRNYSARWNRAHSLLKRGEWAQGWRDYEFRYQSEGLWRPRLIPFAPWQGEPLQGKSILVVAEQGLGDQIMFGSCMPDLVAQAGRVVWECDHRLAALFQRSFPGVQVVGSRHDLVPPWLQRIGEIDYQVSVCGLAGAFRNRLEDFPRHSGYLKADPDKVARWRAELDKLGPGLKVGVSWRGGTAATRRRLRSIALRDLGEILGIRGCRFVSLQYGDCAAEIAEAQRDGIELAHWQAAIDDYDETAALCAALDLTVSVCTAVIHLNGALGRPVWIMVPAVPEWRYGRSGDGMPWYPSARLYRQASDGPWDEVFARVARDLMQRVNRLPS